jgi:hypothetical protein
LRWCCLPSKEKRSLPRNAEQCLDHAAIEKELRKLLRSHDKNQAALFILDRPLSLTPFSGMGVENSYCSPAF